jgi:hypothetical protein
MFHSDSSDNENHYQQLQEAADFRKKSKKKSDKRYKNSKKLKTSRIHEPIHDTPISTDPPYQPLHIPYSTDTIFDSNFQPTSFTIDSFSDELIDDQLILNSSISEISNVSCNSSLKHDDEVDELTNDDSDYIYKESNITLKELACSLMILKFKHKFSEVAVDDILNLIKILIPSPNKCPKTSQTLLKTIPCDTQVEDYLICLNCKIPIQFSNSKKCLTCSNSELVQFCVYDIIPQINKIVMNSKYFDQIKSANNIIRKNQNSPPKQILSALDGKLFSSLPLNNQLYLSVDINSDGAPTVKSRQNSLWPVLGRIVELNQSSREKFDNIIIISDWLASTKPPEAYFEKSFEQLAKLKDKTVNINTMFNRS